MNLTTSSLSDDQVQRLVRHVARYRITTELVASRALGVSAQHVAGIIREHHDLFTAATHPHWAQPMTIVQLTPAGARSVGEGKLARPLAGRYLFDALAALLYCWHGDTPARLLLRPEFYAEDSALRSERVRFDRYYAEMRPQGRTLVRLVIGARREPPRLAQRLHKYANTLHAKPSMEARLRKRTVALAVVLESVAESRALVRSLKRRSLPLQVRVRRLEHLTDLTGLRST